MFFSARTLNIMWMLHKIFILVSLCYFKEKFSIFWLNCVREINMFHVIIILFGVGAEESKMGLTHFLPVQVKARPTKQAGELHSGVCWKIADCTVILTSYIIQIYIIQWHLLKT